MSMSMIDTTGPENSGFIATFQHPNGEEYSILAKGVHDLKEAGEIYVREEQKHSVRCISIERWVRGEEGRRLLAIEDHVCESIVAMLKREDAKCAAVVENDRWSDKGIQQEHYSESLNWTINAIEAGDWRAT